MKNALENVKILDLTRVLAGPFAGMMLADMGAEVVKVENPDGGDDARAFTPFVGDESGYFMCINRNKKSIALNLKDNEDKKIFLELVEKADVVLENYRPGTMEKLGLGYEDLKKVNQTIILASSSGFGQTGPYSKRPAYDAMIQAMSGLMSMTGHTDGVPTKVGASIADITAGMYTAYGIMIALYNKEINGFGQKVDVAMLDSVVSVLENALVRYFVNDEIPTRIGNGHPSIAPFTTYETIDDYVVIAAGNDKLFHNFAMAIELPALLEVEVFKTNAGRVNNMDLHNEMVGPVMKKKTTDEWLKIFEEKEIPCSRINNIKQVVNDPQIIAREMVQVTNHSKVGEFKVPGIPVKLSETPGKIRTAAPMLNEHRDEILKDWLGK